MQGLELAGKFYYELVKPMLETFKPYLQYSSCLLGSGSEVLGYDDNYSKDHHWGVRLQLFLSPDDISLKKELEQFFRENLPPTFLQYSTNWSKPDPHDNFNRFPSPGIPGEINHRIEIYTLPEFMQKQIGFPSADLTIKEWCVISEHQLLEFIEGKVFHDELSPSLEKVRLDFQYFPDPVWKLKMAALWNEVSELFPLMGRTGFSGDNLGSQILSYQLVYLGIRLLFCIWRQYTPYPKWLGKRFSDLAQDTSLSPIINQIFYSSDWQTRQDALIQFFIQIGTEFNNLNLLPRISFTKKQFFSRPQFIIDCDHISTKLFHQIKQEYPHQIKMLGTVNEFMALSQPRDSPAFLREFQHFYEV